MNERERVRGQLRRWGGTAALCRRKQSQINEYDELLKAAIDIGAQSLDGLPRGTDVSNPTAERAERHETMITAYCRRSAELQADIDIALELERHMDAVIAELTAEQQTVLELRYRRRWHWGRIARKLHFSERQVRRIEVRAADTLAGFMDFERMNIKSPL